jgi:hypothetical protein
VGDTVTGRPVGQSRRQIVLRHLPGCCPQGR